jgi:5-methylcytosine-specific restriction endonuclease McrA
MNSVLNYPVVVFNRSWFPIHLTTVRRALCLACNDHAKIVGRDFQSYDFDNWREFSAYIETNRRVSTPSCVIAGPEAIMLTNYSKMPPRKVKFSRRNIYLRDDYTCQYCGRVPPRDELTIDHVIPRSKGGRSTWDNVVLSCYRCNLDKASKTLEEAGLRLLKKPVKPKWSLVDGVQLDVRRIDMTWQRFIDEAYWNTNLDR